MKDKILFVFDYYEYNRNLISPLEDLTFLLILSLLSLLILSRTILKRPLLNLTYENNFDNFEGYKTAFESISSFKQSTRYKRATPTLRASKEYRISTPNVLDVLEIKVSIFYILAKNIENKLFSLTPSEVHNSIPLLIIRNPRILVNKLYLYESERKYKKYYNFYIIV